MDSNVNLSDLSGRRLRNFVYDIENFDLEYRESLGLPLFVSFGLEIEYEQFLKSRVDSFIGNYKNCWISKDDGSLRSGGEINSPIMLDFPKYWDDLRDVCNYLKSHHVDTKHRAGGHVHIGVQVLGDECESWIKFLKMYVIYEHVLYRFFYGDKVSARKNIKKYACPMADDIYYKLSYYESLGNYKRILVDLVTNFCRNSAINFSNINFIHTMESFEKNTIEFRIPNGTVEEVVWQNNVNVLAKMLLAARFNDIDVDYLDYRLKNNRFSSNNDYCLYHEVCLRDSLEFVDMIFNNTLDKVYFLRQYFKNFENNFDIDSAIKIKRFVKKNNR